MELFKLVGRIMLDTSGVETEIDSVISSVSQAGQQAEATGQQMGKAFGKNGSFGAGSVWLGNMMTSLTRKAVSFGKSLVSSGFDYNSQMEQLTVSFATMMGGNTEAAEGLVAELQQLAKVTPMETLGLAKTANLLMGYGVAAEDVIATLTMLGDVAGGSQDKLDHLALAYGQAMGAGKLNAQDANQMINAGVPVWSMLADYMGLTVGEVRELSSEGEITSDVLANVFKEATSDGGRYYKAMENQSKTYAGQLSTMQDTADQAKGALLSPFFDVVSSDVFPQLLVLLEEFSSWCIENKESLSEFAEALGKFAVEGISALLDTFKWLVEHEDVVKGTLTAIGLAFAGIAISTHPILSAIAGLTAFVMWMAGTYDERHEEFIAGIDENKPIAERNAGKYAGWTDAQKDAAYDYLYAYDGGFDTTPEVEAMKAAGLSQAAIDEFRNDVSTALAEGDYSITIEDTWFDETAETELQGQLDEMGLEATVSLVPDYSGLETYVNSGGTVIPSADGSHASGLDCVPFDGYRAILHKDEAVLNATNASVWRNGGGMGDTSRLEASINGLYGLLSQIIANTANGHQVVLETGAVVGQLLPAMDAGLGTVAIRKGRRNG